MQNPPSWRLQACSVCLGPVPCCIFLVWATGPFPFVLLPELLVVILCPLCGPPFVSHAHNRPLVLSLRALSFMSAGPLFYHRLLYCIGCLVHDMLSCYPAIQLVIQLHTGFLISGHFVG